MMVSEYLNKYSIVWLDMASPHKKDIEALGPMVIMMVIAVVYSKRRGWS